MGRGAQGFLTVLLAVATSGAASGGELDPEALDSSRLVYRDCVDRLQALQAERNPFCVALVLVDPSMCARVPGDIRPVCRILTEVRWWMDFLLLPVARIPGSSADPAGRCPAILPPGIQVDDTPCRRMLITHLLLPRRGGRAEVLVKIVNPFEESARCELQVGVRHHAYEPEERVLSLVLPPRSPLDRRIPIRYDAGTQVEVEVICSWEP